MYHYVKCKRCKIKKIIKLFKLSKTHWLECKYLYRSIRNGHITATLKKLFFERKQKQLIYSDLIKVYKMIWKLKNVLKI